MKKRLLMIFAILAIAVTAMARPVDPTTASKVARAFLKNTTGKDYASLTDITSETPFHEFYVFTLNGDKGFILVSGDDCVVPILGYSETSRFVTEGMPAHVMDWMRTYEEQIAFYREKSGGKEFCGSPQVRGQWTGLLNGGYIQPQYESAVIPLVTTTWNQSPYYNNLCPSIGSEQTVTGCVATATAQLMKYWNHPTTGYGSHSYTDASTGSHSVNFGTTTYDWNNMPASLSSTSSSTQVNAVATLMYHVGVALEMSYGVASTGGSSATTGSNSYSHAAANNALMTYFKYKNTLHFEEMENFTATEWSNMLRADLDANRPIIYKGRDVSGGHCFICDGYNTSGQFHFNWGWGGYCDAYYTIGQLNPSPGGTGSSSSSTYNLSNGAILNIQPNTSWSSSATTTVTLASTNTSAGSVTGSGTYNYGDTITIKATANTGNRFYGWSDGSKANPREVPATGGTINLTATIGALTGDTLSYCFDGYTGAWGYGNTSTDLYWGINLPGTLVANRNLNAVQVYIPSTGSYDLYICAGSGTSLTTVLANQSFTVTTTGWNTITLTTPVAAGANQNLGIFIHNNGVSYPVALSSSGGTSNGFLYIAGQTPDQGFYSGGSSYSVMVRGIFDAASSDPGTTPGGPTVVEVGDTTSTTNNTYLPGYNYYNYSYTQQIYTASEIGMAGTITSIAFKNTGAEKTRAYNVYMAHTTKDAFTSGTDWVAMSANDRVFAGTVTFAVGEWTTLTLDNPFVYDGTSNLIVSVADTTGDYTSSPHMACLVYNATSQAIRAYRDASAYDIAAPGVTGSVLSVKNRIQLGITPPAPDTVTIGEGTSAYYYTPIGTYYNYSITEQLYTAEEIGTAGTISSISFYYMGTAEKDFPITVYMQNVSAADLSTGISLAGADVVFNDTLSVTTTPGWVTINLETPFAYDGTSNLLIGVNKGYCYWFSGSTWQYTSISNMARYTQNDNNAYDVNSTVPGTVTNNRPNIQIVITPSAGPSCDRPDSLEVTSITTNTAMMTWVAGSGAFNVEYKLASADTWTRAASNIGWNYMLVNLTPATTYDVRVQSVCSDTVSGWRTASFTTSCGAITSFPWSENFDSYAYGDFSNPCWVNEHITGSGTSVFKVSTSSMGGNSTNQLQLPDMSQGTQTMLRLPEMTFSGNYQFVLDVYRSSSTYNDSYAQEGVRVFASANGSLDSAVEITFIPRNYDVSSGLIPAEDATGWYTYTLPIPITTGTCYIILRGESQYCTSTYMDNFVVEQAPSCPAPIMVTVNYTGGTTATVSWNSNATAFNLDVNGTVIPVTTNPYTLTGLSLATTYTVSVQANCGNGDTSTWTNPVSFTTDFCTPADQCNITITLTDAYSDGGGQIQVVDSLTNAVLATYINDEDDDYGGEGGTYTLPVCQGRTLNFVFAATDGWPHENGWVITNANGDTIAYREGCQSSSSCSTPANGVFASYTVNCAGPCVPMVSEIGDSTSTSTSYNYPVNNYYNYTLSETIIDASEIGGPMDINSISYYYAGATAMTAKTNCTIYVQPTSKTVFSSNSDIEILDPVNAVMVYTGDLNCSQGWNTFTFTTPFNYDGVGNLMVIVDDNSGAYNTSNHTFRTSSCTGYKTLYWYSDSQNPDPTSSTSSASKSYAQYRVVMKLDGCQGTAPSCLVPTGLAVTVGISNATLTWVDSAAAPLYSVTLSDASGVVSYATTTTLSYTFTGLTANSDYTVAVRALCSASDSSRSAVATFHTECDLMTTLPYTYGFEGATTGGGTNPDFAADCWKRLNNGTSNMGYPYISSSSSYCHTGSRGLYWYRSTTTSYGDYQVLVLPGVGGSYVMSDLRVKFWAKATTASYRPVFYVGVMTNPTDASTFVYVDTVNVNTAGNTDWAEYIGNLTGYTGTGRYVAIRANRVGSSSWYACFDDVTLEEIPACVEVSNLAATATHNSVTLTWADQNNTGATYTVSDATNVIASGITGTTYTVTGLTANTSYTFYVTANCSATEASSPVSVAVTTACAPESYPYAENFDSWTSKSACWSFLSGAFNNGAGTPTANTSAWGLQSSYGDYITLSGKALGMNVYSTYRYWAVTPTISMTSNTAQLTFDVAVAGWSSATPNFDANDTMAVAISTNGGASYTPLLVYDNTQLNALSNNYTMVTVPLTGYSGQDVRIAFFGGSSASGGDCRLVIDNVSVGDVPACSPVTSVVASNITTNSATLTWVDQINTGATYTVIGPDGVVASNITGTTYTVTGLSASTSYTFHIVANCSATEYSDSTSVTFRTACGIVTMPWSENFDSWTAKSDCWSYLSGAFNGGAGTPTATTSGWTLSSTYGDYITISGKALAMNIYSSNRYWAVTPAVSITSNAAQLTFDIAVSAWSASTPNYDTDDTLAIAVTTDSGLTYTPLLVYNNTQLNALGNTYTTVTIPVTGYNGQTVRFAIFGGSSATGGDNRVVIDNVSVTEAPSCPAPEITIDSVVDRTVWFHWTSTGDSVFLTLVNSEGVQMWGQFTIASGSVGAAGFYLPEQYFPTGYTYLYGLSFCGTSETTSDTSAWGMEFFPVSCEAEYKCPVTLVLNDSYGDGWNGGELLIYDSITGMTCINRAANNHNVQNTPTSDTVVYNLCSDRTYLVYIEPGQYPEEKSFQILDHNGNVLWSQALGSITSSSDTLGYFHLAPCTSTEPECVAMEAVIGDSTATTTSYNYPVNNYYNYTLSETIIDASEIGGPMDINSISYYYAGATAMTAKTNCTIYVQPTSKTVFSSNSDIEILDPVNAVMVYTGDLNCSQGWNTFTFTTPFNYDGVGNLMVIVDDNSGAYNTSNHTFRTSSCTGYKTLYWYSDSQNPDPTSSTSSASKSYAQYRVVMKLDGCQGTAPSCLVPTGLAVTVGISNATLTWVDSAAAPLYSVTLSDASGVVSYATTTTLSYTFTGLTANSDYTVAVRALCSASDSSRSAVATFHTECDLMTTLPYTYGFEGATTGGGTNPDFAADCWKRLNNGTSNMGYPYISSSSSYCHTGSRGLYWYRSTTTSYGDYQVLVLPGVGGSYVMSDLRVKFWAKATTASYRPVFYVGVMTNPTDASTFVYVDTVNVNTAGNTDWAEYIGNLTGYTGTGRYVAIRANRVGSSSWYACFDDVTLEEIPACVEVSNLAATATHNSVTLTWADQNNTGATYTVSDATNVIASGITGTTYTVTGLTANTSYTFYVTANCSATEASSPVSVAVTTACAPESYPYAENFDSWTSKSACWSFLSGAFNNGAGTPTANTSAWGLQSSYGDYITLSGKALGMNVYSTYRYWAVTPTISMTSNTAQLTFDVAVAGWSSATPNFDANDTMAVAISTNGGASYTPLLVYDNTQLNALSNNYTMVTVPLTGYSGQDVRIAFFGGSSASGGDCRLVIDNVSVGDVPACSPVTSVVASNITTNSATLTWVDQINTGATYTVIGPDGVVASNITGTTYTVTGLSASTSYTFHIVANCSATEYSDSTSVTFRTACGIVTMPWSENFDSWTAKSDCWSYLSGAFNGGAGTPTATTSGWTLSSTYGDYITISGKALAMNIYSSNRYWAVTPAISISSNNAQLTFDVAVAAWSASTPNYDANDTLAIAVTTDSGLTYTPLLVYDNTQLNALGNTFTTVTVPVTGYNGQNVRFAIFGGSSASGGDNRLVIDNVSVTEASQDTVCWPMGIVIGNEASTSTAYTYPVNNYYGYTLSETIIDEAEIGGAMPINGIRYYYNAAAAMTEKTNCTIYLQPTTKTVFSSSSDIELLDPVNAVMVYTGSLNCSQGWNDFTFTTPYNYSGTGNLMVIVDDNSGTYNTSSHLFRTSSCTGYKTLYWYSDSYNPDPATSTSETYSGTKSYAQYRVVMALVTCDTATCHAPLAAVASGVGVNNATVTWTSSNATSYSVTLMSGTNVVNYSTTTDTTKVFTGLLANTDYSVVIRALCPSNDSSSAVTVDFHTECDLMATLPYTYGFEGAATGTASNPVFDADCWKRLNNASSASYIGYPYISSTAYHTGSRGLYWYNYSTVSTYGNYRVAVLPGLGGNYVMSGLRVKFWAKVTSASAHPVFHVGVMTDPTDISTLDTVYTVNVNTAGTTDWAEYTAYLAGYTGTGRYVAIASYPEGTSWTAYVDDVTLEEAPSCTEVTNLAVAGVTSSSVTLTWTDALNTTGTTYTVSDAQGTPIASGITGTTYTVTGLTANTSYTFSVVANCSATEASGTMSVTAHTECELMTTLPYSYGFEGATTGTNTNAAFGAECWHRFTNSASYPGYPYISSTSSYCHTGSRALYWYCGSSTSYGDYQVAVLPGVGGTYEMNHLKLKFWAKASSTSYHPVFVIGVMTDPTDISTFTQVATVNVEGTAWTEYEALLASYTGTGRYVAIRSNRPTSAWTAYFDDVTLEEVSGCQPVANLAATVADNSVTLTWSDPLNTGATYTVIGANGTIATGITATTYTVTGLTPNTAYNFSVVANCSADVASDSASIAVQTECTFLATLPYTMGFEAAEGVSTGSSTSTTFIDCWHRLNNGTQYFGHPYVSTTSSYIHTGARGLYWGNTTTTGTYGDYQCIVMPGLGGNYAMNGLQLKFWARATGTSYHPVLYVGVMTDPTDINSFVYVDTINVEGTTYTEYTSYLNNYTGTGRYVAIRANRPTSSWYLTMDDITLDVMPSCFPVTNLTIASTTTSSMTLAWNDNFNDGATYTVSNAEGVIATGVTGNSYTVTGLNAGTEYTFTVTSNCSATDNSESVSVTGFTACGTLTAADLPYTEDFEAYGSGSAYPIHPCWTKGTNSITAYPYPISTAAAGLRSLYFYGYKPSSTTGTNIYSYAALPQLDATLDASDLSLTFKARRYSTTSVSYRSLIYVGVMTDPTVSSTFVAVDTINMTPLPASSIETYVVNLANYTGTGKYVAFYCPWIDTTSGVVSYNYIYIDDVELDITPSCSPVAGITATNATTSSVTLSWTDAFNTGATYTVYDMSDSTVMGTGITGTTYTVTGLASSSSYTFGVQANCSATDASPIMTVAARTACGVATMPWVENFDGWTAKSDCWAFLSGAFNGGAGTPTANTSAWSLSNSYGDYITISGKALAMNIYSTYRYWAVTPAISISSNNAQLTFDVAVAAWSASTPNYDANDTLAIAITTDSGLTYTPLLVYDNTQLNALGNTFTTITVPVTGYNGQEVRFAIFGGSTSSGGDNRIVVDNVSVTEASGPASTIFMLAANDTTMGTVLPHLGTNTYNAGDSVIIAAVPNAGYLFDYWVVSMDNNDTMHLATNPLRNVVTTGDAGHTYHVTAMFKCDAVAFPFSENFESGVLSNCWTVDGPGTWTVGTGDYTLATGAHTGTYNAKTVHGTTGNVTKLITPTIDFTGVAAAELRFWHLQRAWSGDQDELRVYYRTSATAAWQQLAAYTTEITTYTEEIIQLPNLSSTYQVAFEFTDGYGYGLALDDITINVPPSCTAVTALTATPTDSSVVLSWSDANTGATYTVYDMSDSTVLATGITATTYTVTGLNANTLYTFGVVANCSATDASQFTTVTVRTDCATFTAPYTWTFEEMDANAAPLCWTKVGSGTANVTSSTSNAHNSSKYLRFSGSTSNLIVLPEINGTLSDLQMRLWTRPESTSNSSCGTFSVGYVTDVTDATTFVALETYSYNDFTAYDQKTVRYTGVPAGARMALRHTPTSTSWYWYVDDVTVEEIPSCLPVTGVAVTDVTLNSIGLVWNSVAGAASYIVYNMADTSVIAATVTDTFYTVTGLTAETNYTFGVKSRCSATDVTPMFATVDAYTGYCIPTPTSVDGSGITSVAFGSLTNDAARPSGAGYRNYSNLSGMVATGSPVTVDITYATGYTYGTIIWVDWNNSLTFDSNEVVYVGTSTNTNPTTLSCTFNLPADQALGSYRMRILGADSYFDSYTGSIAAAAGADPCASYSWGVAEDYTLTLVAPSVCPNVAGFTVTGVTNNSVSLSWNTVTGATYTLYNDTAVVATGITDTVYTVTGLTANTDYTFGVVANCSATEASAYPATVSARTLCDNANVPFVETFEATSATRNCWTLDAPSTANAITYVTFDGHTAMRFSSYATATDYNQYAYSPVFNTPATGDSLHVRVRYATYGANDSLWFGIRLANSNDYLWTPTAFSTTGQNDIAYFETNLPINTVQLAIHYYGNYQYYAWIDSVELRVATEAPQVIVYDTTTATACDSYIWRGTTYTATTMANDTVGDTIHVLDLTVNYSVTTTETNTACDSYSWHGNVYTTSTTAVDTLTNAAGCDSIVTLNLTINNSSTGREIITACDSLIWQGNTYTQSGIYTATLTNAAGCDSVVTLSLTISNSIATSVTETVCDSYLWNDSAYTTSTTIVANLTTTAGCDSVVTIALTVNYSTSHTDSASAVDSYTWHGNNYTVSGVYTDTLTNAAGCDSVCLLDLTITYTSLVSIDSAEACDSYTWRGTTYTASTVAHDTVTNATGADSVYILVLTVNYSQRVLDTVMACDSYLWHGTTYTANTTLVDSLLTTAGCDSIVTLTLTVNHSTTSTEYATATDSYIWHNNIYTVTGIYADTLTNAAGCDSICLLDLTITYTSLVSIDSAEACDSYTWRGTTYTASTVAHDTVTNATGADSVYILVLTVNYSQRVLDTVTACDSYTWNGTVYTASTTVVDSLLTIAGCDSTVILNLTVNYSTTHTDTASAVDSYIWHGNKYVVSGVYTDTLPNAAGCDSICTLDLTVTYSTLVDIDTVAACDNYTWRGTTYTASTVATDTVANATGADSVYILVLTVNYSQQVNDTVMACDSYTWHGTTYTANTTVVDSLLTVAGCDSICTLTLTINHGATGTAFLTGCDSILWNDTWYTTSAIVMDTLETVEGCDSIVAVTLLINQSVTTTETVTICDSYEWNGVTYTASTVDTAVFAAVNGCDSTVVLNLTVNYSVETIDSVLAIDSYTWHGTVYERSTVAHDTLTAFNGCDSIETLVLTLNYSASTIDTIVTCDSATWHGRTYYASIVDRDTLTSGAGTDSICLLLLTINYSVTDTFTVSARGQYAWHDSIYTQSGTYYYYGVTQEGCNLTEILILDVDTTQDVYYSVAIVVANTEGQLNVGGTVTGAGSYLAGTEVTLTATPDSGYLFDGWYTRSGLGFGGDLITSDSVYNFTIDSNVVLVAMFERIGANSALLTVQVDSTMGYVLFNGERAPFNIFRGTLGETVTLEAIGQDDNCEFLGWVNTMGDTISRDAVYDYLLDQTTTTLTAAFVRHEGIDNVDASNVTIFARENGVVVRGAAQAEVYVFDVVGRLVGHVSAASDEEFIRLPQTGVYLVKVADLPARRIVVRQ